jgi:hypothetical protein
MPVLTPKLLKKMPTPDAVGEACVGSAGAETELVGLKLVVGPEMKPRYRRPLGPSEYRGRRPLRQRAVHLG